MKKKGLKKKPPPKEPISVRLKGRRAQFLCAPEIQKRLKKLFRYEAPGARFADAYVLGTWDGFHQLMRSGGVSIGLFLEMRPELEAAGWKFTVQDLRKKPGYLNLPPDPAARPYQQRAVKAMSTTSSGGIVLVATGAGKTRLTGDFFRRATGSCLFCVDELTLLEQTRLALEKVVGERIGVVGRGEFDPQRVTVATIQTLHKHRERDEFKTWFRAVEVIVIDELHLALAKRNLDVVKAARPKAVFGLTATLEWEKPHVRMPAAELCGPIIFRYEMAKGVEEGYLSKGVAVAVKYRDRLKGTAPGYSYRDDREIRGEVVSIPPGSPQAEYRYRIALSGPRNALIAELAREGVRRGRRVVALVERKAHIRALSRRLADVPHAVISGAVKAGDRIDGKNAMEAGKLPLLLATRVFGKGIDITTVNVVIDGTGLPDRNAAQQRYGRGARLSESKDGLIYIDVADAGNHYARAAFLRREALEALGVPVIFKEWKGDNAAEIYEAALERLASRRKLARTA